MLDFDLSQFLPYQLAVLSERVSKDFATLYRERFGISRAEWRVLAHLSQADSVSVRDIHVQVELDKSKISRAASRLEAAGYITKKLNESDRRLISLALTEKGTALMEEMTPLAREYEARVLSRLGDDAAAFLAAVQKLSQDRSVV
ncbi:MarR family winged helix-turn-helix transcriptional regulator [Pseudoruegeria sp. HB172150]|uniref:MarR family winged helix-turn-helix transcriptional regulator n=1 Tax=Pseudoruegeria sp. HB172150 TaxID=2721164 RepID=UPI0015528D56|nr:MarR family transcriptional regulator [Pseudoruegeria sp. HB172150]